MGRGEGERKGEKKTTNSHPRMESHKFHHTFIILLLYRVDVVHSFADLI